MHANNDEKQHCSDNANNHVCIHILQFINENIECHVLIALRRSLCS